MTFEDARQMALALPEVEESTGYGRPNFRVRRRSFAGAPSVRGASEEEARGLLVVRVDPLEREALLADSGHAYFVTPHYESHPWVLVRLAVANPQEVRELLIEAWLAVAPRRLAATHEARLLGS